MRLKGTTSQAAGGLAGVLAFTGAVLFASEAISVGQPAPAQAPSAPKVEVRGIRIVGDAYGDARHRLSAYNWNKGTNVALFITKPDGGIIEFTRANSRLTKFTDDKGTNLAAVTEGSWGDDQPFGPFQQVSSDGKARIVEIQGAGAPTKGAAVVSASGMISLRCGSKKVTAKQENVALTPGTKIIAGAITFEVSKTGKPEMFAFGGMPGAAKAGDRWSVTLHANADCSNIAEIKFLDAASREMEVRDGGSSSTSFGNAVAAEKTFILPKKVDFATIVITYWTDMKEVKVPFDIKATLGLQ